MNRSDMAIKLGLCMGMGYGIWLVIQHTTHTDEYGTIGATIYLSCLIVFAYLQSTE